MKKILFIIFFIFVLFPVYVYADNYNEKELIPIEVSTTIKTDNFIYKNMIYKDGKIDFEYIKNKSVNEIPVSISVALFDKNKKNMGMVNYCDENKILAYKESINNITLDVSNFSIALDKNVSDIKYIALWNDNITCKKSDSSEYIGQKIEEMGVIKEDNSVTDPKLLMYVLMVAGGLLVFGFLYKFMFTNTYSNMNGDNIRKEYQMRHEEMKKEREESYITEPIASDTESVVMQEEVPKNEEKEVSDLENLFK